MNPRNVSEIVRGIKRSIEDIFSDEIPITTVERYDDDSFKAVVTISRDYIRTSELTKLKNIGLEFTEAYQVDNHDFNIEFYVHEDKLCNWLEEVA